MRAFCFLVLAGCAGSPPTPDAPPRPAPPPPVAATVASAADTVSVHAVTPPAAPPTFAEDVAFLEKRDKPIVLTNAVGGKVLLSATYQGRVMTSAVAASGRSLGWVNRDFIEAGKTGTAFDNYGGEDRFWLGPEGGQFGLYFPPAKAFTFDAWQTPHPLQEGAWPVKEQAADHVTFEKSITVTNWSGAELAVAVERTARLVSEDDAKKILGVTFADGIGFVAYETRNRISNAGKAAWKKETGLPSIWILAQFAPASDARIVIPFETNAPKGSEIVNDRYFGKVPSDRLKIHEADGFLSFVGDGKHRGKIGLGPTRAKGVLGSYSAEGKLLTIVTYDGPKKGAPYVNSMWEQQKEPFHGDAINSYNDGPNGPEGKTLGGFYEIETSSPAAALAPGKDLVHVHRTFHFVGEPAALEPIAKKVLGVSLAAIAN